MKVIGVGDNVLDIYYNERKMYLGGNALNFSVFAKKLGYDSSFVGIFGDDQLGKYAIKVLKSLEININHSQIRNGENGYSIIKIQNGNRKFVKSNHGGVLKGGFMFNEKDIDYLNTFDLLHFNINGHADKYLSSVTSPIVYDFSDFFTMDRVIQNAPLINLACFSVPNLTKNQIKDLCLKVSSLGCKFILCTMGERGSAAMFAGKMYYQEAFPAEVIDTMGAGDSFITSFSTSFFNSQEHDEKAVKRSLKRASLSASRQVTISGSLGFGKIIE